MKKTLRLSNNETYAYLETNPHHSEVMILIHGNMSSSIHYQPIWDALAQDHRVLAMDLRGFGDSTYHTPIESLKDLAQDVALFMEALDVEQAHVVGWSTGGGIALELALLEPKKVRSLVLLESASVLGYPIYRKDAQFQPILTELYQSKEDMAQDPVQVVPAVQAMQNNDIAFMKAVWEAAIYNVQKPSEKHLNVFLSESLKQCNLVDIDWALMTFNLTDQSNGVVAGNGTVNDLKTPILNVWGRQDFVIPEIMFQQNQQYLKTAQHLIYDDGSHSPLTDFPERLAHDILQFINKH